MKIYFLVPTIYCALPINQTKNENHFPKFEALLIGETRQMPFYGAEFIN